MRLDFADGSASVELNTNAIYENETDSVKVQRDSKEYIEQLMKKFEAVSVPQRRIDEFKEKFDCVVVNDFGDDYHLSEEEREAKNKFYTAFRKFSKCKRKYRKIGEYVIAMREALNCLDAVAKHNGALIDPDEFKNDFFKGKIEIVGLKLPKFVGRDKKRIDKDYLSEFILSDKDPSILLKELNKVDEVYSEEELKDFASTLFTKEELDEIISNSEIDDNSITNVEYLADDEDDFYGKNVCVPLSDKDTKKFIRNNPALVYILKNQKMKARQLDSISKFAYDFSLEDIEELATYDTSHNRGMIGKSEMPVFHGDVTDSKAYHKYLIELDDWMKSHITEEYLGKTRTIEQIEEIKIKELLDEGGWNIRAFAEAKEKEKKLKKIRKSEKKREKELKAQLMSLQEKRNRHRKLGTDYDDEDVKKALKKDAKNKKKSKKKAKNAIDDILLTKNRQASFKDFKENALDWRF